jgi:mRNA-degrading endonuclease toxin of MazEF toxin-antitoxin module
VSAKFSKEDVIQNKKQAIKDLNHMLEGFINDPTGQRLKKANLLSYWLKDYVRMVDFEETFDPKRNIAYKRGDIVKLNFGFNIGSEYGGLHYAIVINNKNPHNSSVVTVIPLTSQKGDAHVHHNDVELGNELYRSLKLKYDTIAQQVQAECEEIDKMLGLINILTTAVDVALATPAGSPEASEAASAAQKYMEIANDLKSDWQIKSEQNQKESKQLEKIKAEIDQMKTGSIALVDQITTVSKIRIYDPRNAYGVLSGIRLSPESLDRINSKIKELFVF